MKKFLLSLVVVAVLTIFAQLCFYGLVFWMKAGRIDASYTVNPGQKHIFIGSSQIGCGIEQSDAFGTKVMWTCATPVQVSLFQIRELERRGQLKDVKTVCINLNYMSIKTPLEEKSVLTAFYRHLPTSLRYLDTPGVGWFKFLKHCVTVSHFPYAAISPDEKPPHPRPSILTTYTEKRVKATRDHHHKWGSEWSLTDAEKQESVEMWNYYLDQFNAICKRNNIRLVVVEMPMPKDFEVAMNPAGRAFLGQLQSLAREKGIAVWRSNKLYDLEDWADLYHQTEDCAHRFTADLCEFLNQEKTDAHPARP